MENIELKTEVWQLLSQSTPELKNRFKALTETKQEETETFAFFFEAHAQKAAKIYNSFFEMADNTPDKESAIAKVLSAYKELLMKENPDMINFALLVFLTHHESAVRAKIEIPPITLREPELVIPSFDTQLTSESAKQAGASPPEDKLSWYREDPSFNEHHEHWHMVYPFLGIERRKNGKMQLIFRDRQGEIFLYMHQQMLARYDTERIVVGLERVKPYGDFSQPILSGYDPGEFIRNTFNYHAKRDPQTTPGDIDRVMYGHKFSKTIKDHHSIRDKYIESIKAGYFKTQTRKRWKITPDLLGATLEANKVGSVDLSEYDYYHNNGHRFIAVAHDPKGNSPMGVMSRPETSFRDPVFYELHKHIDDLSVLWQKTQPPHDFSDYPKIELRKGIDENGEPWSPDIILCSHQDLERLYDAGITHEQILDFFGEANWNKDFTHGEYSIVDEKIKTISTLKTKMEGGIIKYLDQDGHEKIHKYSYLNNEPFAYFVRIYNTFPLTRPVTLRTFLVMDGYENDRSMYIEIDKFRVDLQPKHNVIYRPSTESSVVRKPAILNPAAQNTNYSPDWIPIPTLPTDQSNDLKKLKVFKTDLNKYRIRFLEGAALYFQPIEVKLNILLNRAENKPTKKNIKLLFDALEQYRTAIYDYSFERSFCSCGLPYSMLLPRGTSNGQGFKLFVFISDWEIDRVGDDDCCSSMSFCGAKDRYPDSRPMGYPFDRVFEKSVLETFRDLPNTGFRSIKILCQNIP